MLNTQLKHDIVLYCQMSKIELCEVSQSGVSNYLKNPEIYYISILRDFNSHDLDHGLSMFSD